MLHIMFSHFHSAFQVLDKWTYDNLLSNSCIQLNEQLRELWVRPWFAHSYPHVVNREGFPSSNDMQTLIWPSFLSADRGADKHQVMSLGISFLIIAAVFILLTHITQLGKMVGEEIWNMLICYADHIGDVTSQTLRQSYMWWTQVIQIACR
jgi:hypothetical protein